MKLNYKEIKRKIWHILWGVILFLFISYTNKQIYQTVLGILLLIGVIVFLMLRKNIKIGIVDFLIKHIGRKDEGIEASFYYIFSIFLTSFFFSQNIVALSALILGVCDGVATIFGIHSKTKIYKNKTVIGSSAFLISCFLIIYLAGYDKLIALTVSVILTLIELFTGINDNLIIPVAFSIFIKMFS